MTAPDRERFTVVDRQLPVKCPHCGEDEQRLIEEHTTYYFCQVCGKTWPRVDIQGVPMDGP